MRRWLAGCLAILAVLSMMAAAAPVSVTVRGDSVVWTDAAPYVEDGRTMTPVRAVAEAMGLEVAWDGADRRVEVSRTYSPESSLYQAELQSGLREYVAQRTVRMWVGRETYEVVNQYAVYDGRAAVVSRVGESTGEMDAAPTLRGGRTYVPIRYVAEQFGYDVLWEGGSRTVQIVTQLTPGWSYAWSIEPGGSLVLAIHTPVNVASAEITSVTVSGLAGSATPALEEPGEADLARIRATAGESAQLLDVVRLTYPFAAGSSYVLSFSLALTKANGAAAEGGGSFQVTLPAAAE